MSLVLAGLTFTLSKPQSRPILLASYFGCILPDLVDLGPAIVNHALGFGLPTPKIFPWHWPRYSGSIYDGSHKLESAFLQLAILAVSISLVVRYRGALLRSDST